MEYVGLIKEKRKETNGSTTSLFEVSIPYDFSNKTAKELKAYVKNLLGGDEVGISSVKLNGGYNKRKDTVIVRLRYREATKGY